MNKKLQYYVWIVEAYIKKNKSKLFGYILLSLASIYFLSIQIPNITKPQNDIFYEAIVGKYTLKSLPPQVLEYISQGLVRIDDQGKPIPDVAESVTSSPDGKKFTVKLKKDIKWHDNTSIKAQDLGYNLADVEVEKPDESTMVFSLKDSFAPFPTLLSAPLIKVTPSNEVLGVGEYKITGVNYRQTQYLTSLTLEPINKNNSLKKIIINYYPTDTDAQIAFKLGQAHGTRLPPQSSLASWNNSIIYSKVMPRRFVGVFFQLKDPIVGGKESTLRKALSNAIPDF
ncbi:MAG: ABC transporter substrate-binding protein, partial [bacterium]|nr:ABC transporter substrate-binding protein [bacterium]